MSHRPSRFAAGLAAVAFALAFALSAAPHWHERLHDVTATHQCAVTLVAAGTCDDVAGALPQCQPDFVPAGSALTPTGVQVVSHALDSALLEHAPPLS